MSRADKIIRINAARVKIINERIAALKNTDENHKFFLGHLKSAILSGITQIDNMARENPKVTRERCTVAAVDVELTELEATIGKYSDLTEQEATEFNQLICDLAADRKYAIQAMERSENAASQQYRGNTTYEQEYSTLDQEQSSSDAMEQQQMSDVWTFDQGLIQEMAPQVVIGVQKPHSQTQKAAKLQEDSSPAPEASNGGLFSFWSAKKPSFNFRCNEKVTLAQQAQEANQLIQLVRGCIRYEVQTFSGAYCRIPLMKRNFLEEDENDHGRPLLRALEKIQGKHDKVLETQSAKQFEYLSQVVATIKQHLMAGQARVYGNSTPTQLIEVIQDDESRRSHRPFKVRLANAIETHIHKQSGKSLRQSGDCSDKYVKVVVDWLTAYEEAAFAAGNDRHATDYEAPSLLQRWSPF